MSQPYSTGAVQYFIQLPKDSVRFLGTTESVPTIDTERAWDVVMNDLAGSKLPFDYIYEGEESIISVVLTRFNYATINAMEIAAGGPTQSVLDMGTLMMTEGFTFKLWVKYTAGGRPSMPGMPLGRRYLGAILWGPDKNEGGTRAHKRHFIFRCIRVWDITTLSFRLWDEDLTAVSSASIA